MTGVTILGVGELCYYHQQIADGLIRSTRGRGMLDVQAVQVRRAQLIAFLEEQMGRSLPPKRPDA